MQNRPQTKAFAAKFMMTAALALSVSACATASKPIPSLRPMTAQHIAGAAHLMPNFIPAGDFTILSYERVTKADKPVTVYIEGDGAVKNSDLSLEGDPTPIDPVALRMAADDGSPNVIYLGRPCQYTGLMGTQACTKALYTTHRYSPQTIDAMSAALDNIRKRDDVTAFNLVGFEGGAAMAIELAATRDDVKSLKTIAGILDTRVAAHGWSHNPYAGSLNPIDAASKVASIPQTHSIASWDKRRSLEMIHNFMQAEGNPADASVGAPMDMKIDHSITDDYVPPAPPTPVDSTPGQPPVPLQ